MDRDSGSEKMPPPPTPASGDQDSERELSKEEKISIEKEQERKLKSKYPMMGGGGARLAGAGGGGGHSAFLQKRLAKGQKYFDSGDYQMAKQKTKGAAAMSRVAIPVLAEPSTGDTIPTPDMVPARKTSIIQPLHDHSQSMHLPSDPAHSAAQAPGQLLPNPAFNKLAS